MKKILLVATMATVSAGAFFAWQKYQAYDPNTVYAQVRELTGKDEEEHEGYDGAAAREKWEYDAIKDPVTGKIPHQDLINAVQYTQAAKRSLTFRTQALLWSERGPNFDVVGASNGNGRPGNGYTSGRMRAVWVDLNDVTKKTVFVGGICGGIWKTTDITASPATWTLISDQMQNMAVSSIAQDPVNKNIMYLGTGEKTYNADAVRGGGVWKSTDNGVTWTRLNNTTNFYNISKIACDAVGNVYIAGIGNNVGIRRSTDGGANWTEITPTGLSKDVTDFDISSTGRLHVVCGYYFGAITYRYTTAPATVTTGTWTAPAVSFINGNQYNCDITSSGNTIYALPSDANDETPTIFKSSDGGANWAATTTAPSGTGNNALSSGQGWYCLALAVDQANADNVFVGGLNGYRTTNGGLTWEQVAVWVSGVNFTVFNYVHADHQAAYWDGNRLLVATDGGIFYSADNGATFVDRNRNLRLKQFYSVALHPSNMNYFLAGAQDNGVHQLNSAGMGSSTEVTGGDGAFVDISTTNGNLQFGSYVFNDYYRSTNGGANWSNVYFSGAGRFINPFDYDEVTNAVYACYGNNTLLRWSNPTASNAGTTFTVTGLGTTNAVKPSPYTAGTLFAGSTGGVLYKITGANTASGSADATATYIGDAGFSGSISCINLGTNDNTMVVVMSNYNVNNVWYTTDGGANWSQIDGNLPNMPVRWAVFPTGVNNKLIIATEAGVYTSGIINGASTVWTPSTGFPTVRTDMLKIRASDNTLAAATHGRGLWTASVFQVLPVHNLVLKGNLDVAGQSNLTWTNMDASPQARFHLQFSNDGLNYTDVADLAYTKTSFKHLMPVAQGYYRVVGVEPNAAPVVSNVVLLRNNNNGRGMQLTVAPNPVRNSATLLLSGAETGNYQWEIVTSAGQVIRKGSGSSQKNTTESIPVYVTGLSAGTYWIKFVQGKTFVTSAFIKE